MSDAPVVYQIKVEGSVDAAWSSWFDGMRITSEKSEPGPMVTVLTGPVIDQAALRGMLWKLWDLNLVLISVHRLGARNKEEEKDE